VCAGASFLCFTLAPLLKPAASLKRVIILFSVIRAKRLQFFQLKSEKID